jgi:phospholipid/cholesterol/gamma-HCH transport system ATP-binding protein
MVSLRGVSKSFDGRAVLRNIDLEIAQGEIVAIMGSSGGGKTTLLRCISGLSPATSGEVVVDGIYVGKDPEGARHRMGMVFQSAALFDYMNVHDNVLFGIKRQLRLSSKEQKTFVAQALERVGLQGEDDKMPDELSGGMRKRVGIARAIALQPRVMLYDEPTTGLDPITTYTIDRLISDLRKDLNVTTLVVSHDVSSVFRIADRVAFLHDGELIFTGSPEEFSRSPEASIRELVSKSQATAFES